MFSHRLSPHCPRGLSDSRCAAYSFYPASAVAGRPPSPRRINYSYTNYVKQCQTYPPPPSLDIRRACWRGRKGGRTQRDRVYISREGGQKEVGGHSQTMSARSALRVAGRWAQKQTRALVGCVSVTVRQRGGGIENPEKFCGYDM